MTTRWIACALGSLVYALLLAASACAENIDLSTVPTRDAVQLTIYNSEDITLVRETRKVTFKKGANPLQFSWANTLIDPSSAQLRFLTQADKLEVLDTTYPARQAADAVLERRKPVRRRSDDRDHLFHERHHLDGRLHRHRGCGREGDAPGRLCPRPQQLGRGIRGCPGAAGRGDDQPRRENRAAREHLDERSQEHAGRRLCERPPRCSDSNVQTGGTWRSRKASRANPRRLSRKA